MKLLLLLVALSSISVAHASGGAVVGNGGDICEDRFRTISQDLRSWIQGGGANNLLILEGTSVAQYSAQMLSLIDQASINCTDANLYFNRAREICVNSFSPSGMPQILCNRSAFLTSSESAQYVVVHHEYAELAGFGSGDGGPYDELISQQIPNFLFEESTSSVVSPVVDNETPGESCEDRFKKVRDVIGASIGSGDFLGLKLPTGVSPDQYDSEMLGEMNQAQISCADSPISLDGVNKTCINFVTESGEPQIVCNRQLFLQTTAFGQFVLVHHEYAGLAGLEINNGDESLYTISNQILPNFSDHLALTPLALTP